LNEAIPLRLKYKVLLLAVVPLLVSVGLVAFALEHEQSSLAERSRLQLRTTSINAKEEELRHYVALALSTISPLYNTGRNDEAIKDQVKKQLANLAYGPDGYFFLYDMQGVKLMDPRQPELVGQNLIEMRDSRGEPTLRMLLERARSGGGFVVFRWRKPSTQKETPILGYVTVLERWGWMIGTGNYLDDVDAAASQFDEELERNIHATLLWIAGAAGLGITLILAGTLTLRFTEQKASDAKLTLLARKVVHSQEEERAHLSRDLHDGTGQTLVATKLLVESSMNQLGNSNEAVRALLTRALDRLTQALHEVRDMSHRLRPALLDTLGLTAALQSLGEEMFGHNANNFQLEVEGESHELPDDVNTVFFRIAQEAMTNIQKHADSDRVSVRLAFQDDGITMSVHDDGRGFDAESMRQNPSRGIGLRNMRERIETVGGQLAVWSQPGHTRISATLLRSAIQRFRTHN
jgi:two-component system, NarL family, sensor kinase